MLFPWDTRKKSQGLRKGRKAEWRECGRAWKESSEHKAKTGEKAGLSDRWGGQSEKQ